MSIKEQLDEISFGQAVVQLFNQWFDMMVNGELPDCKRYRNEFFEVYDVSTVAEDSSLYLMFCSFVGAIDMCDYLDSKKGGAVNE